MGSAFDHSYKWDDRCRCASGTVRWAQYGWKGGGTMNTRRTLVAAAAFAAAIVAGRARAQETQPAAEPPEERYEELEKRVRTLEADAEREPKGLMLRIPGRPEWERPDLWMWPGFRAEETRDVLIGGATGLNVFMGVHSVGRFQWLEQDAEIRGSEAPDLEPAFQTAWGDLAFMVEVGDGDVIVFFDLYLSSRPHPSTTYGNEGYMLFRRIPDDSGVANALNNAIFEHVNVKAGHFEIDFGDAHYRRSDNAWVSRNPLIGNYLVDPDVEEIGMEIFSKPHWPVKWLFGVTSGTTTENLNEGRGLASVHGKLWWDPVDDFRLSGSAYYVDHSDNPPSGAQGTSGRLFSSRRSGGPYGGVWGGGNSPGDLTIGADELVTAFQVDATWSPGPWEFYGNLGWVEDADPNGSLPGKPTERWMYGALETVYFFNPRTYAAGRYSAALADDVKGSDSDGMIHRFQVGGGYWLMKNALVKAEYVYQFAEGFDEDDGLVAGVDVADDPTFNGILLEVSFKF